MVKSPIEHKEPITGFCLIGRIRKLVREVRPLPVVGFLLPTTFTSPIKKNMENEKNKTLTVSKVFAWIFGVLFLLGGFGNITNNFLAGILFILASAVILPPLYDLVRKKMKLNLSKGLRIFIALILLAVAGSSVGNKTFNEITSVNTKDDSGNQVETQKTEEYSEVKTFTGKGNQNTESFSVTGGKVKITATTTGSHVGSYSGIELKKEEGGYTGPGLSIMTEGAENGVGETTYRNIKPGQYYIQVISGVNWTVKVEQTN